MSFSLPAYNEPDFSSIHTTDDARLAPAPKDGVAPEGYHATTPFPEYFRMGGVWKLAGQSRMDCVAVFCEATADIEIVEFRNLKQGDMVVLGRSGDGTEGIYVHTDAFRKNTPQNGHFAFRTGRSRETAYSKDYDFLTALLRHEREFGKTVWVLGPAVVFDASSRNAMVRLIDNGYCDCVLAGNALATHDLEAALEHTALGQDIYTQHPVENGHYNHIDTLNKVRACGSIEQFLQEYGITDGVMRSLHQHNVPYVLAGSIRDDGPLPEVLHSVYEAQDKMRDHIREATTVICLATQLHSITAGNLTPTYKVEASGVRPVYFFSVDVSEFAVNKLRDRGTLSVRTVVTNAQDFLVNLTRGLELR